METEEYQQLEEQLKTAGSYQDRLAIRNKMRELKRGTNPVRVPIAGNAEPATQKTPETDSLLRPKSTIITTNGLNNSKPQLENGFRKSYTPVSNSKDIRTPRVSNSVRDSPSTDHLSNTKLNGESNEIKKLSPRFNGERILISRTPPVSRKEPLKSDDSDEAGSRRRARTMDSVDIGPEAITIQQLSKQQVQHGLTDYINRELRPIKKIVPTGESLYLVSADPRILCRLINVSKKNTVDMRCLTDISDHATDREIKVAVEENMTLAVESARSIGCHITEEDVLKIIHHDSDIIHKVLLKILQARVIDFSGMDELPSWYFSEPSFLFDKLNIPVPEDASNTSSPAHRTTNSAAPVSATSNTVADSSPPASNKLTTPATTNNIKKHSAQEIYKSSNNEDSPPNSGSGFKIRRVRSDAPPDEKEKPENKNITKPGAGVRGLTASFEKFHPTTGPKSTGTQARIDPAQNEIRRQSPNSSNRPHRNTTYTKSNDFPSTDTVEPVVEKREKQVVRTPSIPETQSLPRIPSIPETQSLPVTTRNETASENLLSSPYSSPQKTSFKSLDNNTALAQERSYRGMKSDSSDDILDSDPKLQTHTQTKPKLSPRKDSKSLSLATDELSPKTISSQNSSTSNSETVTPIEANENPLKDTDEYLLTLDEKDPNLSYEQRKQIRKLKRIRKQTESKK